MIGLLTNVIKGYDITRALYNLYHFSNICFMVDWIFGFYVRFTPSGQTCSGTFDAEFKDGDLYQQGIFILIAGCFIFIVFALTAL